MAVSKPSRRLWRNLCTCSMVPKMLKFQVIFKGGEVGKMRMDYAPLSNFYRSEWLSCFDPESSSHNTSMAVVYQCFSFDWCRFKTISCLHTLIVTFIALYDAQLFSIHVEHLHLILDAYYYNRIYSVKCMKWDRFVLDLSSRKIWRKKALLGHKTRATTQSLFY